MKLEATHIETKRPRALTCESGATVKSSHVTKPGDVEEIGTSNTLTDRPALNSRSGVRNVVILEIGRSCPVNWRIPETRPSGSYGAKSTRSSE